MICGNSKRHGKQRLERLRQQIHGDCDRSDAPYRAIEYRSANCRKGIGHDVIFGMGRQVPSDASNRSRFTCWTASSTIFFASSFCMFLENANCGSCGYLYRFNLEIVMLALQQVDAELQKRSMLVVRFITVPGVADMVVSYSVSAYQLFQEAMLRLHWVDSSLMYLSCRRELLDELFALETKYSLVAQFMADIRGTPTNCRNYGLCCLTNALELDKIFQRCHRSKCGYINRCTCNRPLYAIDVLLGLPLDSF